MRMQLAQEGSFLKKKQPLKVTESCFVDVG